MNLQALCKRWQKLFRLQDWDITVEVMGVVAYHKLEVSRGWEAGVSNAHNVINSDRKKAEIFVSIDAPDKKTSLAHELVHILVNPLHLSAKSTLDCVPSKDVSDIMATHIEEGLELVVYAVSRALLSAESAEYK